MTSTYYIDNNLGRNQSHHFFAASRFTSMNYLLHLCRVGIDNVIERTLNSIELAEVSYNCSVSQFTGFALNAPMQAATDQLSIQHTTPSHSKNSYTRKTTSTLTHLPTPTTSPSCVSQPRPPPSPASAAIPPLLLSSPSTA
jgi:hypothetical protein